MLLKLPPALNNARYGLVNIYLGSYSRALLQKTLVVAKLFKDLLPFMVLKCLLFAAVQWMLLPFSIRHVKMSVRISAVLIEDFIGVFRPIQ